MYSDEGTCPKCPFLDPPLALNIPQYTTYNNIMLFTYRPIFQRHTGKDHLLIIQCDAGHLNIDLIACARHRIIDERVSAVSQINSITKMKATHVVFIVQLPKQAGGTKFVGFQGAQWYSVHIDDLSPPKGFSFDLPNVIDQSVSEIFKLYSGAKSKPGALTQYEKVHGLIQKAASCLQDHEKSGHRTIERINILINLIPTDDSSYNGKYKSVCRWRQLL